MRATKRHFALVYVHCGVTQRERDRCKIKRRKITVNYFGIHYWNMLICDIFCSVCNIK